MSNISCKFLLLFVYRPTIFFIAPTHFLCNRVISPFRFYQTKFTCLLSEHGREKIVEPFLNRCPSAMGIQGLLSYCLDHREQCVEYTDLIDQARRQDGIEVLCDFYSFEHLLLRNFWKSVEGVSGNQFIRLLGGEYRSLDAYVSKLVSDLRDLGIKLVMFVDGAKGSSKLVTEQKLETWKYSSSRSTIFE